MLEIKLPAGRLLRIENLLLDLNGTLTCDGEILPGVPERLQELCNHLNVVIVTCDTHGNAELLGKELGVSVFRVTQAQEAREKESVVDEFGPDSTAAIGNGASDVLMLKKSALSVAVIGTEGASTRAVLSADITVHSILDGLDLFLRPPRIVASLRG